VKTQGDKTRSTTRDWLGEKRIPLALPDDLRSEATISGPCRQSGRGPERRPARACLSARSSSARLGSATPDGWLWAKIIAAALCVSATLTTSRG
jgi:hypothetical protein